MNITYNETIPDLNTYFELRKSVKWDNFCVEQGFKICPHEHCRPALRKLIYT